MVWALYRCNLPACSKLVRTQMPSGGKRCPSCDTGWLVFVKARPTRQQLIDHERAEGVRAS